MLLSLHTPPGLPSAFRNFGTEVKRFAKTNWWIFVVYTLCLGLVYRTEPDRVISVYVVTSFHFVADMFIMMMLGYYQQKQFVAGTWCQIFSLLIFLTLKAYTGLTTHDWNYLLSDPLYILAAIKNYRADVKGKSTPFINLPLMIVLSMVLMPLSLLASRADLPQDTLYHLLVVWVQTAGIFLFAIALSITENEGCRFGLSLVALSLMVLGSAWKAYSSWAGGVIDGLAISYTLLPLTVLIYYLRIPQLRSHVS